MIPLSRAFKASLASPYQTKCTLWLVTLVSGQVLGFTDCDQQITYNGVTYNSIVGYTRTDIASSAALNVDNLEVDGPLLAPSLTEIAIASGEWDYAAIQISLVNWGDFFLPISIPTLTSSSGLAHAFPVDLSQLVIGDTVVIAGATQPQYNGPQVITNIGGGQFNYAISGSPSSPATGTIVYYTSMGELIYRTGTLGQITVERNVFKAELRGLTQSYTRVIGQLTSPTCRTTLGSALCKVNLTPFTFSGAVTSVNADNRTFYDTSLTQPGPSGGIAITHITNANPGHVTLSASLGLPSGSPITISGVIGMYEVNTNTYALNVNGNQFDLPDDTTHFGTYVSGGTVTPLGGSSGYFDNGVVTWLTGNNSISGGAYTNLRMEVQSYVPGQVILELPMPFLMQAGDTYSIHAGCDYSFSTCRLRFSNALNFRGEPYVPGMDQITQVGKQ